MILTTLGPLLAALILGFYWNIKAISNETIDRFLKWLTFSMLALIGYSIGGLENLAIKLYEAGFIACVIFLLIITLNVAALTVSGRLYARGAKNTTEVKQTSIKLDWSSFSDSVQTIFWVVIGTIIGYVTEGVFHFAETIVTWMLYVLLFLIGQQLLRANYRLRALLINPLGLIISFVTIVSTLFAGLLGAILLDLPIAYGLAVVSGFGWYSLSGILLSDLGYPMLGTTSFLLDIGREIFALMMIPILSKVNNQCGVGLSGATAMDFTLPMLGKFHGAIIIPTAIASGFVMSLSVPVLIPLFMSFT